MGSVAAVSRVNSIGGFYVERISADVMRAFLAESEIAPDRVDPSCETAEQLGVALTLYFREAISEEDLCKCERCGGEGPATHPSCPFCGLLAAADPTNVEPLAAKMAADDAATPAKKKNKKTTPDAAEVPTKKEEETMTTTATVESGKGKKGKKTTTALATVPKGTIAPVEAKGAIVEGTEVVYSVGDLDRALQRIEVLKATASCSVWALGQELREVKEKKLWKFRVTKGKAAYTSFDQFCENEAKLSSTHAYSLIEIAENFSEKDVQEFGTSKLTLLLKVAPEDRPALKESAKKKSKRQLASEVSKVVKERGGAKKKNPKHSAAAKKGAAAKHAKSDKITIAMIEGRKTVKLFAKPESIRNIDWKALKRAKTIDAQPFGKLELTNEVSILLAVVKTEEGLEIVANIRRD
jgi:hypothetical protein